MAEIPYDVVTVPRHVEGLLNTQTLTGPPLLVSYTFDMPVISFDSVL